MAVALSKAETPRFVVSAEAVVAAALEHLDPLAVKASGGLLAEGGVENLKEILTQVRISEEHVEQKRAKDFVHRCLVAIRAGLNKWDMGDLSDIHLATPLPETPFHEGNSVWSIEHPSRRLFYDEVQAGKGFLRLQLPDEEPWRWLGDLLAKLEYNLDFGF